MPSTKPVTLKIVTSDPDVFDPSIEGVAPITRDGTPVPKPLVREVLAAAKSQGVDVRRA